MSRELRIPIPSGGACELIDGQMVSSYYPMTTGQNVVAALMTARTGEFPRKNVVVNDLNDSLAVEIDRLVELHLEQFRAALLETLKGQTSKCELHVLRPALQLRLQLPDCDSTEIGAHKLGDTIKYRPVGQAQPRIGVIKRIVGETAWMDNGDRVDECHILDEEVAK